MFLARWILLMAWVGAVAFAGPGFARELGEMSGPEIEVLQQRLTDGECFTGAIDGKASAALEAAKQACPDQEPVLRIETGMHVAQIYRIGVDAKCKLAATGSGDKTVRLWSLPDGRLLHTFRVPIGKGRGGGVAAVAVSPDGRYVAAGGWDAYDENVGLGTVYVFNAVNGEVTARLGPFENVINHLAFSGDGRWLAATLGRNWGLRVIDATDWREVTKDGGYGDSSEGAAFGPDGRLYTVADDGKLRRYSAGRDFKLEASVATRSGKKPHSVAIDPQGERIAVGFADTTEVDLYDAPSLTFNRAADTRGVDKGDLNVVAWRGDSTALLAGGYYSQFGISLLTLLDRDGHRLGKQLRTLADNTITNFAPCGDGFALAAGDPAFGWVDGSGDTRLWRRSVAADMRDKLGDAFTVARDGKSVRFGLSYGGKTPVIFDVAHATLDDAERPLPGLNAPAITGLPVTKWQNDNAPTFANEPIALRTDELSRSLAIRPGRLGFIAESNRLGFVLGTDEYLRIFDALGVEVKKIAAPAFAYGVNVTTDDRLIVAAYYDGTIRWHRIDDGRELLALFVNRDTKAWVAWTPSGYYMASPGGEDLIGWHVNRGWAQAADFYPASRFRDHFNRPDIVKLVLTTRDEAEAVKQVDAKAHRVEDKTPLLARLPPLIRISDPPAGFGTAKASLSYVFRSPARLPVDSLELLIDGRPIRDFALPVRKADANADVQGMIKFNMPPHDVNVALIARSGDISSEVAQVKLAWTGPPPPKPEERKLHALVVGISDYLDPDMALQYAAKDARDVAEVLQAQKGVYYADVETRVLSDKAATRQSLLDGLQWLASQAKSPYDVTVLYLAGHGVTDEKLRYWYLPADANAGNFSTRGLSQEDVRQALKNIPGKVVWFLDTCHAGGAAKLSPVDVNTLVNTVAAAENGGIVAFASSKGDETSVESNLWNNGAFTKALVEGIAQGKAAFGRPAITTSLLDAYLESRVSELTDDTQHPVMRREQPDFTFALAHEP